MTYNDVIILLITDDLFLYWKAKVDLEIQLQASVHMNSLLYTDDEVIIQKIALYRKQYVYWVVFQVTIMYRFQVLNKKWWHLVSDRYLTATKIVVDNHIVDQVSSFNTSNVSYGCETNKLSKFRIICGTMNDNLRNKTRNKLKWNFIKQ